MMRILRVIWLGLALTIAGRVPAAAQLPIPVAFEARAGLTAPVGDFQDAVVGGGVERGTHAAVGVRVQPIERAGAYVGYQWIRFGCPGCAAFGMEDALRSEALELGIHLALPAAGLPLAPWVRGGLLRQTLAFSHADGEFPSEASTGFSAGAGVATAALRGVAVGLGVRYLAAPAEFRFGTGFPERSLEMTALSVDLGITLEFSRSR